MKIDFQAALKQLSQTAKAEQAAKEAVEAKARQIQQRTVNFTEEMRGVTPLKSTNQYHHPQDKTPIKVRRQAEEHLAQENHFFVSDAGEQIPPDVFSKNGRGEHDIRRLQAKHWPIVGFLDLHGYRQEEAQETLNAFVDYVQKRGVCGEIVHGSGLGSKDYMPVLKNTVRRWLMAHPEVIAYAQPNLRNDGTVLVLLKQRRKPKEN
ncbi:Smr/MutS family protein [Stenoxybacter acetivorans]|uniref:Smr/MutS family protein n=1 Tax=Stenoxybacter acetivorans TaxID=422441 RepID=UPI000564D04C|nr:Smr/MutS family protein [Stenoxybacter acetivorans]